MQTKATFAALALAVVTATSGLQAGPSAAEASVAARSHYLQIGYRGLNLAPLFWQIPAERYRVEFRRVASTGETSAADPVVIRLDTAEMNPSMFHITGVGAGTYQVRMWVEVGEHSQLVDESAVIVADPMLLAFVPTSKDLGTAVASR